jgi:Coenzyme PQQ synthesis protein D (PqqD)
MFWVRPTKGNQTDLPASGERRFRIPEDVQLSLHDQGLVLLSLRTGLLFHANRAGATIWSGINQGKGENALAIELAREFGITPERAAEDTSCFVQSLIDSNLLTTADEA